MSALSELLHCYGYYGFGGGYALQKYGPADDTKYLACTRCDRNTACWERHKIRVRQILPALCELSDLVMQDGFKGPAYMKEFQRRAMDVKKPDTPEQMVEPYLLVMYGNLADGQYVAAGQPPADRKDSSLTWPLQVIE